MLSTTWRVSINWLCKLQTNAAILCDFLIHRKTRKSSVWCLFICLPVPSHVVPNDSPEGSEEKNAASVRFSLSVRWLIRLLALQMCPSQMGEKERKLYLFIPFFGNSPTGQTSRRIFTLDGSNDANFLWGFRRYCSPFLGVKSPKTIGAFRLNKQNIESFKVTKLLHRFQPFFEQQ